MLFRNLSSLSGVDDSTSDCEDVEYLTICLKIKIMQFPMSEKRDVNKKIGISYDQYYFEQEKRSLCFELFSDALFLQVFMFCLKLLINALQKTKYLIKNNSQ